MDQVLHNLALSQAQLIALAALVVDGKKAAQECLAVELKHKHDSESVAFWSQRVRNLVELELLIDQA